MLWETRRVHNRSLVYVEITFNNYHYVFQSMQRYFKAITSTLICVIRLPLWICILFTHVNSFGLKIISQTCGFVYSWIQQPQWKCIFHVFCYHANNYSKQCAMSDTSTLGNPIPRIIVDPWGYTRLHVLVACGCTKRVLIVIMSYKKERKMTLMLPLVWIMVLLHLQVGLNLYVIM